MHIAVVGSGYVGLVAGACFADLGHEVILVDNDEQKLAALKAGQVPIHENFLPELLGRHRGSRLEFSGDLQKAVRASGAIFIAVGTPPTEQGEADLSYVESVARSISGAINGYKVVIEKSTVPVYTSDWIRKIILRNAAPPDSFDVASNPEFLREGSAVTDFLYPDRIVVGSDSRIGPRFLNPGIGYGGSCFPKDLSAFRAVARECGYEFRLLDEVMRINEEQRHRFLRKVRSALWTLRGKRIGILGLAFKGGTDDIRESPAVLLAQSLLQEGCQIAAYDPAAMGRAREILNSNVDFVNSAYEAAAGADALLILTEWEEFGGLDLKRLYKELKYPIVIDGRNLYDPEIMAQRGFTYYSVGRQASAPETQNAAAATPARKLKR